MRFFTLSSLAIFFGASISSASAATVNASSCMSPAVQTAVNSAVNGDTVLIPAGTCDWGASTLAVPGGVYLKGSGKTATIIRGSSQSNQTLVNFNCSNGRVATFSDMTLIGKGNPAVWDQGISLLNGCKSFKVFNSKFTDFVNAGVSVNGDSHGVTYSNDFVNNYRAGQTGGTTGYGVVVYGNGTWPALELGTANAVFVEDNYFYGNRCNIASNNGARYVFRYNTAVATDPVLNYSMVDAHGKASSPRGSRSWEIYNNTFSTNMVTGVAERGATGLHGGDGVVFNNVLTNPETFARMVEITVTPPVTAYPTTDQMTSGYFWNNTAAAWPNGDPTKRLIDKGTPSNFVEGRDYFQYARPGYKPYTYPHPLTQSVVPTLQSPRNLRVVP